MKQKFFTLALAALPAFYVSSPCVAQTRFPAPRVTQPSPSEVTITPSTRKGLFVFEAEKKTTTLLSLLRAVVQPSHRTLIISDEATARLEQSTSSFSRVELSTQAVDEFVGMIALVADLSWDKVGQETYVLVPKTKKPVVVKKRKVITPEQRRGDYWRFVPLDEK